MVRRCAAVSPPVILIRLHLDLGAAPETWGPFLRNALLPPCAGLEDCEVLSRLECPTLRTPQETELKFVLAL